MCILFPIAYRRGDYSEDLSKEVEATIPAAPTRNTKKTHTGGGDQSQAN
jgi:hypothetical protein